jgi:hypothetical protein
MSRRHPSRRMTGKHFAQIPVEVLTSEAFISLLAYAVRLLLAIAAQYRGNNNGDLAMTRAIARTFGINSHWQLERGLATLLEHGLIEKTRQGGKKPLGPCLYAVTWQPIDDLKGKIESGPTPCASNAWAKWTAAPKADEDKINHQPLRRATSAPSAGQRTPISAPSAGQTACDISPSGGSPSRISPEGLADSAGAKERIGSVRPAVSGRDGL